MHRSSHAHTARVRIVCRSDGLDMSSSASDPLSGIPQELKDLFSWNPPRLNPFSFPTSIKTRPPAFFDKHFSKELKLLRVKCLSSLAHDIAAIVDKIIMDSFNDDVQFSPSDTLLSARQRNSAVRSIGRDIVHERTTSTFCAPVASTLALRLSDWDSLLVWTRSANVSGYATADGLLKVAVTRRHSLRRPWIKKGSGSSDCFQHIQTLPSYLLTVKC